jgi:hypothetical protein
MKFYYYNCQIKQQRINALIIHSRDDILYRHWSVTELFDIKTEDIFVCSTKYHN